MVSLSLYRKIKETKEKERNKLAGNYAMQISRSKLRKGDQW
jgi:hypothetical protein